MSVSATCTRFTVLYGRRVYHSTKRCLLREGERERDAATSRGENSRPTREHLEPDISCVPDTQSAQVTAPQHSYSDG